MKNESFPTLKVGDLDFLRNLIHLDLSMNKISVIDGGFECVNLRTLILSDNLIKEITPKTFQKLPNLQVLHMDINNLSKIENLHMNTKLVELSLSNNRLTKMEGLATLTNLRRLNLSFNKIQKLEGISTLLMLEVL